MCAYSLDHITPSRLGVIGFGGTKPELEYNDSINKVSEDTRLSLYDTSGHSNLKRFATSQFSKNTNPASTPHPFQIFMCVRSSEFVSGIVVGLGGLEPPASPLSGVRSNHLSYRPKSRARLVWWSLSGSNRRPPACKAGALPAELKPHMKRDAPAVSPWALPGTLNAGHLCGRLTGNFLSLVSKGGDPAAPSDTATLLRLHPSHRPHRGKRPPEG